MSEKREKTIVRRKQIVNAARKVIVKYGSEHVTVKRIAREVGVTEGAIYRHFKSKRDVLAMLVDEIGGSLLSETDFTVNGPDALETLQAIVKNIQEGRGVFFQVIAEIVSLGDRRLNKKVSVAINAFIARIREILAEGVQAGVIRDDIDLDATATLFFGMTQGVVNIWTLSGYNFDLEDKYAYLWDVFHEAVAKHKVSHTVG